MVGSEITGSFRFTIWEPIAIFNCHPPEQVTAEHRMIVDICKVMVNHKETTG